MFEYEWREQQLDRVAGLLAMRDRLDRELAVAVADAQRSDAWMACGHRGARRFLRAHTAQSSEAVHVLLRRARLLREHPLTADTVDSLSTGALDVLSQVVTEDRDELYDRDEMLLLEHAQRLSLRDFEIVLAHWADLADNEHEPPTAELPHRLYVQQRFDGGADIHGTLHEHGTLTLLAALDAYDTGPDRIDDPAPRSLAERRADALIDIAAAALGGTHRDTPAGPVGDTTIVIDALTLAGRTDTQDLDGIVSEIKGRTISGAVIDRLLCNTWISALIVNADGVVIDATERSTPFSTTQRRLIAARDRHCVFPGCTQPPSRCDAHHLHDRKHDGRNQLTNGCLLCRRHHRLIHTGWHLQHTDDHTWETVSPTGRTWTEHRGPPRPAHGTTALAS